MVSEREVFAPVFPICFRDLAFLKANLTSKDQGEEGIQQPFLYALSPGLLLHVQQTAIIFPTLSAAAAVLMDKKSFVLLFTSLVRFTSEWDLAF